MTTQAEAHDSDTKAMLRAILAGQKTEEQLLQIGSVVAEIKRGVDKVQEEVGEVASDVSAMKKRLDGDGDGKTGLIARVTELERGAQHAMTATAARASVIVAVVSAIAAIVGAIIVTRTAAPPPSTPPAAQQARP